MKLVGTDNEASSALLEGARGSVKKGLVCHEAYFQLLKE